MAKLVPTTKTRAALRSRTRPLPAESDWQPLVALRNAIDRAFDEFTSGWPLGERMFRLRPWAQLPMVIGAAAPATDVIEEDNQFTVAVEMPGMAATDIDVSLSGDLLTVRGEKPETREEKRRKVTASPSDTTVSSNAASASRQVSTRTESRRGTKKVC